ncbi:hypothetical protein [Streptomyces sp. NPDC002611]
MTAGTGSAASETPTRRTRIPRIATGITAGAASLALTLLLTTAPERLGLSTSPALMDRVRSEDRASDAFIFAWALISIPLAGLLQTPLALARRARIGAGWALIAVYVLEPAHSHLPMAPQSRRGRGGSTGTAGSAGGGAFRLRRSETQDVTSPTTITTAGPPNTTASPTPNHPLPSPRTTCRTPTNPIATASNSGGGNQGQGSGSATGSPRRPSLKAAYQYRAHHHTSSHEETAPAPDPTRAAHSSP